ncbi:MAG: hypothetical protein IJZ80_02855, partial [Clostridia bacterium]|nr:hypothetical protein [Clostridia bacterium]
TTPEVTTPEETTPEVTTPEETTPEATTPEKTTTAEPTGTTQTKEPDDSGCKSSAGSVLLILATCVGAAWAVRRKHE